MVYVIIIHGDVEVVGDMIKEVVNEVICNLWIAIGYDDIMSLYVDDVIEVDVDVKDDDGDDVKIPYFSPWDRLNLICIGNL